MRATTLLIAIASVALLGAFSGRGTHRASIDEFHFEASKLKDKTLWTQVNSEPYYISSTVDALCAAPTADHYAAARKQNPHASTFITVYVNNIGREAMFSKQPKFPEGSVIVKEKKGNNSEARTTTLLYTVMRKREAGYNPTVGDWEFSVVSGEGTKVEASGKIQNCQSCHLPQKDSDFVFRPYLSPLARNKF